MLEIIRHMKPPCTIILVLIRALFPALHITYVSAQLLQGKTLGPVSKKRLHEMWQKFKTDSKSKVSANFICIRVIAACIAHACRHRRHM